MKYRTVIELLCDAADSDDASNMAGDYLKGEIDFGVEMKCKTVSIWSHRMKRYTAVCAVTFLVFSALLIKFVPVEDAKTGKMSQRLAFKSTYTVTPELKTKDKQEFKEEWNKKKAEAVLEYIKK
ncbi:MAG: hypothetical protein P9L90_00675 [Candidatus Aadella gelida]|nr:hypothetical protein [Candidatus Aadella gelida]